MQEQNCVTCSVKFDYYKKVATVICPLNHVVCKQCSEILYSTNSKCPHCLGPLLNKSKQNPYYPDLSNPNSSNQSNHVINPNQQIYKPNQYNQPNNQNYQNPHYPQPNQYQQPQNQHPYRNDQQQQQPQVQVHVANQNMLQNSFCFSPKKLGCLLFFFLIIFGVCSGLSYAVNTCSFYGRQDCYYYEVDWDVCCRGYCRNDWYDPDCSSTASLQVSYLYIYSLTGFFGVLSIAMMIRICVVQRILRRNRLQNAALYVRV